MNENYSSEQLAEIYAKLEVAKILSEMGAKMAKEAANDLTFFKITNGIPDQEN